MTCNVVLQNFQGTYSPGNTISGHLVCTFSSRENIRAVRVKLCGKEHTDWVAGEVYYDSLYMKHRYGNVPYSGDNEFLDMDITLIRGETMAPGRYEYPFTFTLPRTMPTNFQGNRGYIKYSIKGIIDLTFAFTYEDEIYFNMRVPINFNDIRAELQMEPRSYQEEKIISCCFCASGPILLDVHLQKEAFVLGEVANIKMDVTNMSDEHVHEINVNLIMIIESKATNPRTSVKRDTDLLAAITDTGVGAYSERTYELDFEIPSSAMIHNFNGCTLFKRWFVLKVEAVIEGCNSNMDVETAVMIGHIPLGDGAQSQPLHQISDPLSAIPEGKVPPYPVGPSKFPLPSSTTGQIGFSLPPSSDIPHTHILPSVGMAPVPVHDAPFPPGFSAAVASLAKYVPSAPTQEEMADEEDFDMIDAEDRSCTSSEVPPPPYCDAVSTPFLPGAHPSGPANHNGHSAPLPK